MEFYIAILKKASNNELPSTIVSDITLTYQSVMDLIEVGYLTGSLVMTPMGPVIQNVAITDAGQRFLERNIVPAIKTEKSAVMAVLGLLLASAVMLILFFCFVTAFRYLEL